MAGSERDPYEVLGIGRDASPDEIKAAYRRKAEIFHPDRYRERPAEVLEEASRMMQELNAARAALHDQEARRPRREPGSTSGSERRTTSAIHEVPPLVGLTLPQAKIMVASLGWDLEVHEVVVATGDQLVGLIVDQAPTAGTDLGFGQQVAVRVARAVTPGEIATVVAQRAGERAKDLGHKAAEIWSGAKAFTEDVRNDKIARDKETWRVWEERRQRESSRQREAELQQKAADDLDLRRRQELQALDGQVECLSCGECHDYYTIFDVDGVDASVYGGRPSHAVLALECPSCHRGVETADLLTVEWARVCPHCRHAIVRRGASATAKEHRNRQRPAKRRRRG